MKVVTPEAAALASCSRGPACEITPDAPGTLDVRGTDGEHIGRIAAAHGIPLFELTPQTASLEQAFMDLTQDSVEYALDPRRQPKEHGMSTHPTSPRRRPAYASPRPGPALRVAQALDPALHLDHLISASALTLGIGIMMGATYDGGDEGDIDTVILTLLGTQFSQICLAVLGILVTAGEYSTGMIRASLTAVPRRLPVLWAKAAVFTTVAFTLSSSPTS